MFVLSLWFWWNRPRHFLLLARCCPPATFLFPAPPAPLPTANISAEVLFNSFWELCESIALESLLPAISNSHLACVRLHFAFKTTDGFHKLYNFVCEQFGAAIAYTIQVASSTIRDDCSMEYVYIYTISASCSIEHMSKCTQPVHPVASTFLSYPRPPCQPPTPPDESVKRQGGFQPLSPKQRSFVVSVQARYSITSAAYGFVG